MSTTHFHPLSPCLTLFESEFHLSSGRGACALEMFFQLLFAKQWVGFKWDLPNIFILEEGLVVS